MHCAKHQRKYDSADRIHIDNCTTVRSAVPALFCWLACDALRPPACMTGCASQEGGACLAVAQGVQLSDCLCHVMQRPRCLRRGRCCRTGPIRTSLTVAISCARQPQLCATAAPTPPPPPPGRTRTAAARRLNFRSRCVCRAGLLSRLRDAPGACECLKVHCRHSCRPGSAADNFGGHTQNPAPFLLFAQAHDLPDTV